MDFSNGIVNALNISKESQNLIDKQLEGVQEIKLQEIEESHLIQNNDSAEQFQQPNEQSENKIIQQIDNQNQNSNEEEVETSNQREHRILEMIKQTQINTEIVNQNFQKNQRHSKALIKHLLERMKRQEVQMRLISYFKMHITVQKLNIYEYRIVFSNTMGEMADRIFRVMASDRDDIFQPEICDIETAATDIVRCSMVIMFVGDEVFEPYGMPNLNNPDYMNMFPAQRYPSFKTMKDLLTIPFSEEYWDFYQSVQTLFSGFPPTDIHSLIAQTLLRFNEEGQNMFLLTNVTINLKQKLKQVDGNILRQVHKLQPQQYIKYQYEDEEQKEDPSLPQELKNTIIELNGCIHEFFCDQCKITFRAQVQQSQSPTCIKCKTNSMQVIDFKFESPTLKQTQSYSQIQNILSQIDRYTCFIKVGSFDNCPEVQEILQKVIENNSLIVEVGSEPVLELGKIKQIIGETSMVFETLCENMKVRYY